MAVAAVRFLISNITPVGYTYLPTNAIGKSKKGFRVFSPLARGGSWPQSGLPSLRINVGSSGRARGHSWRSERAAVRPGSLAGARGGGVPRDSGRMTSGQRIQSVAQEGNKGERGSKVGGGRSM